MIFQEPQVPTTPTLTASTRFNQLQWLAETEQLHLRFQLLKSGREARTHIIPLDKNDTKAVVIAGDKEWAASLTQASSVNIRKVAPRIAALLPAGIFFTAPVNLAKSVSSVWAEMHNSATKLHAQDACFVMHRPKLPRVPQGLPLVLASELGRDKAAEEMAFCALGVYNRAIPLSEFINLLGYADAVLWRKPQGPVESFRVFTELSPQTDISPRRILLGISCGKAEHAPLTFAHLAHQKGKVMALVDAEHTAHMQMLESTGFERKRSVNLATYLLG